MKSYIINGFKNKQAYFDFINYMVLNSDKFSLVYFKYSENEALKKSAKEIKNLLKSYKIYAINGNQWPSTVTLNENNHIYNITLYKSVAGVEKILTKVEDIFDWDYPLYPMDLCFYKDGYAWFASSAHEHFAYFYINDKQTYCDLIDLGIDLSDAGDIDESKLFLEESLKVIVKKFNEANHI